MNYYSPHNATERRIPMRQDFYRKNMALIAVETVLSSVGVGFAVSIMNVFWNSIGMNQTDIVEGVRW